MRIDPAENLKQHRYRIRNNKTLNQVNGFIYSVLIVAVIATLLFLCKDYFAMFFKLFIELWRTIS